MSDDSSTSTTTTTTTRAESIAGKVNGPVSSTQPPKQQIYLLPAHPEMYFLSDNLKQLALKMYMELDTVDPDRSNKFFETFGPGNIVLYPDRPHERFNDYEKLLKLMFDNDHIKYRSIHKGAPFFFMSWLAFDLRNYEKALFYMDSAISEDIRLDPSDWLSLPAGSFLTLTLPEFQIAHRTINMIQVLLNKEINRFNSISDLKPIIIQNLTEKFVKKLVQDIEKRTIVSALYVYILEFKERYQELELRSTMGGSIAPFIIHLFKGALIFESLLKYLYVKKDEIKKVKTLGNIFDLPTFKKDFFAIPKTSSYSIKAIYDYVPDNSIESAFTVTTMLRNTTGHNLIWDDEVFKDSQKYEVLFQQEMNAILYLIDKKFYF